MKVFVEETQTRFGETWIEAGTYQVVRMLERNRAIINVTKRGGGKRALTVISMADAEIV